MKKRILTIFLSIMMCLSSLNLNILADSTPSDYDVTKNLNDLVDSIELVGVEVGEDGSYHLVANQPYSIKITFKETFDLEFDMTDFVRYILPAGVVVPNENSTISIGVTDGGVYIPIMHAYVMQDGVLTITWDVDDEYFYDLARAHGIEFTIVLQGVFDGSSGEVHFGEGEVIPIIIDVTGSVTITKDITGLKSDVTLTDAQKEQMTFELRDAENKVVKEFTYAEMENGSITFKPMDPGAYTVVETGHPDVPLYTFDTNDSKTTDNGTLKNGGQLNLGLTNDYDFDKGNLELNKTVGFHNWDDSTTAPEGYEDDITFTITGPYGYSKTVSYADFTEGKYLLEGLDVGQYTITETNSVTGYSWTYTVNNSPSTTASATAQVTKDSNASVTFDNRYEEHTADLTIKKAATGATVPADTEFIITFPDGTQKSIKYEDMINGEYTFENVPLGTYKVTEVHASAEVENYTLTVSGEGNITISENNGDKTKTITNKYTGLGSLKISKSVLGDLSAADLTDAQKKAITFTVYDSANKAVKTLTYYDILNGNDTISDLPVGTYTIKETASTVPGYTMTCDPAGKSVSATVTVGGTATASFENTYSKDEYKLSVGKEFADGSYYDASNLPNDIKNNTRFTISDSKGTVVASCTLAELSTVLNDLTVSGPGPYTISETNPSIPGMVISTQISIDGGDSYSNGSSKSITLTNHVPAEIVFKNNYTIQGKAVGIKEVEGLTEYQEKKLRERITFSIYYEKDGVFTLFRENVSLAEVEAGLVLPAGNYYVQETGSVGVSGYDGPDVETWVNGNPVKLQTYTDIFEIVQGGEVYFAFKNKYNIGEGSGKVKLTKYVKGLDEIGSTDTIVLTEDLAVNNTDGKLLFDGIKFHIDEYIKDEDKWYNVGDFTLQQFINGEVKLLAGHYRMIELGGEVDGYSLHVDYLLKAESETETDQSANTQIEFDVTKSGQLKIEATNVYTKLGNLIITKTITGDLVDVYKTYLSDSSRKTITFIVEGPFDFHDEFTFNDIADSSKKYNYGVKEYHNVPVGEYTVTETTKELTNYYVSSKTVNPANGKVNVPVGGTAYVEFVNEYSRKRGNLTITKALEGDVPDVLLESQKKAMKFEVLDSSKKVVASATYNEFIEGKYTFTDLPIGTYTVVETIGDELTEIYHIDITNNNKSASITFNKTTNVTITNTFNETGNLKLVKNFAGFDISDDLKNTVQFKYWLVDENNNKIGDETTVNYSDFVDGELVIKHLIPGRYVVEEVNDATGYKRTTTVQVNDGAVENGTHAETTITFGGTSTVTFNNTYEEVASLKITKTLKGALTTLSDAQKKAIIFTVTDSENKEVASFSYYDMSSGSKTISGLKPGVYTVTETINDPDHSLFGAYTTVTQYKVGTAAVKNGTTTEITLVHGSNTIAFTNTYTKIDSLKVVKSSSNTYVGLVEKDGNKYPVWRFTLAITNLNTLTTANGTTTMTDVFDSVHADWFRLATKAEVASALGITDGSAKNYEITSLVSGKQAPDAEFNSENNTIVISNITADTADKCNFTYYVIVTDEDTLHELNAPQSATKTTVTHNFTNTVSYHPMPYPLTGVTDPATTTAKYVYNFTAVVKGLENVDEEGNLYDIVGGEKMLVNYANYQIVLNKDGMTLGNQATITATDTFSSNQTVQVSSIVTDPVDGVSYQVNNENHTIVFTIPNGTPVTVKYRVNIEKSDEFKVNLENKIELVGFEDGINEDVNRSVGGEGGAEVISVKVIKIDSLNNKIRIPNVTFALYDGTTNELLTTAITNANGVAQFKYWDETGALRENYDYYLKEVAPADGYNLNSDKIWFRIKINATTTEGYSVIPNGGELIVENDPVVGNFQVTKSFNNWDKQSSFTFVLEPVEEGNPMPENGGETVICKRDNPATPEDESTGIFGQIRFDANIADLAGDKEVVYHYTIQEVVTDETKVPGVTYDTTKYPVTVTVSDHNNDGIMEVSIVYGENSSSLTVTNKYSEGSLTISKELEGNDIDLDKEFEFTITLDAEINGTFSGVVFKDGVAKIKLKGGQSKTIEGLPNGVGYLVEETDYSSEEYICDHPDGISGVIDDSKVSFAGFKNTRNSYGDLIVSKTVTGNDSDKTKLFHFTVTLDDTSINGTYGEMTFKDGVAEFDLKDGETKKAEGLPNGVGYKVVESDYSNDGYVTTKTGDDDIIVGKETKEAKFNNNRDTYGGLIVSKLVNGNDCDKNKSFHFVVTLTDTSINGEYGDMIFKDGVAEFDLKSGESKLAEKLPNGVHYTVTETDYTNDGYVTTKTGDEGDIVGKEIKEAKFTNTRDTFGDLIVSKTVNGNDCDKTKLFHFVVTLDDDSINGTYGEMTFVNGVAEFDLKDGETKKAEGLPNGVGYKVVESDYSNDGYETTKSGDDDVIVGKETKEAKFTNTKDTFGDLIVSKTVTGNDCDKTKLFHFVVTLDDDSINGTYGDMTFKDGVAEFDLKDGESKKAVKLPNGVGYKVTETDYTNDGYVTTKTGDDDVIVGKETKEAKFNNHRDTFGDLIVSKTVKGNDIDLNKKFHFVVTLDDTSINGTYGEMTFKDGVAEFDLKDGETKKAEGLPNGVGYKVVESDYSADGYGTSKTGDDDVIVGGQTKEAKFTNTRDTFGNLIVSKTVTGNDGDKTKLFHFVVTLTDTSINGTYGEMTFVNGVAEFDLKDGETKKAELLPNGVHYTVTETDYTNDGYVTTKSGDDGDIVDRETKEAKFNNHRDTFGDLIVSKTVKGNDCDKTKLFHFVVTLTDDSINGTYGEMTFKDGVAEFDLKDGETKKAEGLPNGVHYTVTETNYSNDGYVTTKSGDDGDIVGGQSKEAAFINTRDTYGDLIVSKIVAGNDGDKTKLFHFTVTLDDDSINGTYGEMTFKDGVAEFDLKDGETKKAVNLPNGVGYKVTETDYTNDGYETSKTGDDDIIVGGQTKEAKFTNTRDTFGDLIVSKSVKGNDIDLNKKFHFVVTLDDTSINGTYGEMTFKDGVAEFDLKDGETKKAEGLPNGVGYKVVESDYSNDGYGTTKTGDDDVIIGGQTQKAEFTNTRYTYGDLIVSKIVKGNDCDKTKLFHFVVTLTDTSINGVYGEMTFVNGVAEFDLKDGETKKASGLPTGVEYKVTESDYSNDGYVCSSPNGISGTIDDDNVEFAEFTNTRDTFGDLIVSKTVTGNACDKTKLFHFVVTLDDDSINGTYGEMTFKDGVAEFDLKDGETKKAEGLPNGIEYKVVESDYSSEGYETTKTGDDDVIVGKETKEAKFTNTKDTFGDLIVSKTVTGNDGDKTKLFHFIVTLDDDSINGTYGEMTFVNGVVEFDLKDGETKKAVKLPNGVGYKVVESDYSNDGYETTKTGDDDVIVGDSTREAKFKNNRDTYGNLSVSKTVNGNDCDKTKLFHFVVTLDDDSINGTYGEMTFVNGVAEFDLKDGETKTAEGLPNGVGYKVVESDYSNDGYETTKSGDDDVIVGKETKEAKFTNTKDTFGDLIVSKTVTGNDCDKTKLFHFVVTLDDDSINGTYGEMTFKDGVAEFDLKDGESKKAVKLPNGVGYKVTETDYTNDGYVTTKTGDDDVIVGKETKEAKFNNHRDTFGDLIVSKTVNGNDCDKTKLFHFVVTLDVDSINGTYGEMTFVNGVAEFDLKDGETKKAEGLPNGVGYKVVESDYSADGYETTKSGDDDVIVGKETKEAKFTNTRDTFGDLIVSKTVTGNDGDKTKLFHFTVTLDDDSINGTYGEMTFVNGVAEFDLKDGETKKAEGLPNGVGYKVVESDYSADGYETTKSGDDDVIVGKETKEAKFNNHRDTYGNLIVTKTVDGNDADENKEFRFTVTLDDKSINGVYGEMTFVDGVAQFTLKHGENKKAEGLPNGVGYKVTEANYLVEEYVTTKTGDDDVIVGLDTKTAAFINTRNTYGMLIVSKFVGGNDYDSNKSFNFKVVLDDDSINGTYGSMTFKDGVAEFKLKDGESIIAENLPNGIRYTVYEDDYSYDGYVTEKIGDNGIIVGHEYAECEFTNIRDTYGDLIVTKSVAGNAGDKDKEFTFTVILDDTRINGIYGEMEFVDGVATFTLKDGESKKAESLPNGVKYIVIEEDYSKAGYKTDKTGDVGYIVGNDVQEADFINIRDIPYTGDRNNLMLWISMFFISASSFALPSIIEKKKEDEE